jgi:hypothetical protein
MHTTIGTNIPTPVPAASAANKATVAAIATNLTTLRTILDDAAICAAEADGFMAAGDRNAAVGSILMLEQSLADVGALHRAILLLHRRAG